MEVKCPVCIKGKLKIRQTAHEVPYFGTIIMATMKCENCGFTHKDIWSPEEHKPMRYELHVEEPEDLNIRVVRSATAIIEIPELGVRIEPGPLAEAFISNVEGVLERIENAVIMMSISAETSEEKRKCEEFLNKVWEARNGKIKFTLILEDPLGNSTIISEKEGKVKVRELTEKEIEYLKRRIYGS